jgi:hypothetical protein
MSIGRVLAIRGDRSAAHGVWREALALFEAIGSREAVSVRRLIAGD